MELLDRISHAWNAFTSRDPTGYTYMSASSASYYPSGRIRLTRGNERSILAALFTRIAIDVSQLIFQHCIVDDEDRFIEVVKTSGLHRCLTLNANLDQSSRDFIRDIVLSMFDEGVLAVVPVDTTMDPDVTGSYDIQSMRTGRIMNWYPRDVEINVYNDRNGERQNIFMQKKNVCIIENPLYEVVNEPNSTVRRLIRKLNLLDIIDEHNGSEKLDLIIQLPYSTRSKTRKAQAEERRKEIEMQLASSKYGIAYIDGTEHVTQLNRSVENNLLKQVEYLTNMAYSQLGVTQAVMDGTADEQTMLNYHSRTIEPIASAIVDAMNWKFLTPTARTKGHKIMFFRDPFKLAPVNSIAEVADKMTRNEIMSKNEIRQIIGRKPSKDPKADQLINSNISHPNDANPVKQTSEPVEESKEGGKDQNGKV